MSLKWECLNSEYHSIYDGDIPDDIDQLYNEAYEMKILLTSDIDLKPDIPFQSLKLYLTEKINDLKAELKARQNQVEGLLQYQIALGYELDELHAQLINGPVLPTQEDLINIREYLDMPTEKKHQYNIPPPPVETLAIDKKKSIRSVKYDRNPHDDDVSREKSKLLVIKRRVIQLRQEISNFWNKIHCSDSEKAHFLANFKSDIFSIELLTAHYTELKRVRKFAFTNKKLLSLIPERDTLYHQRQILDDKIEALEVINNDTEKLVQVVIENNLVTKKINAIESNMVELANAYEKKTNKICTVFGLPVAEYIKNSIDKFYRLYLEAYELKLYLTSDINLKPDIPLCLLHSYLAESLNNLRVELMDRRNQINLLLIEQTRVNNELGGCSKPLAKGLVLPMPKDLIELRLYLDKVIEQRPARYIIYQDLLHKIKKLNNEQGLYFSYEQHILWINPARHLHEESLLMLNDMYEHAKIRPSTLQKKQLITQARQEVVFWWQHMFFSDKQKHEFEWFTSKSHPDIVLDRHYKEIQRLRNFYFANSTLFKLIERRNYWQQKLEGTTNRKIQEIIDKCECEIRYFVNRYGGADRQYFIKYAKPLTVSTESDCYCSKC